MRIVLDANAFVSALLTRRGNAHRIIELLEERDFELLVSDPILSEVGRVLRYPHIATIHRKSAQDIDAYIESLRQGAIVVEPQVRLQVSSDESDNRYIECAIAGSADVLVTGDKKHLLPIKEYRGVPILSPAEFLVFVQMDS